MSVNFTSFSSGSVVENLPACAGDAGLIPGPGRSPGERNGYPIQYSCLENPMDGGNPWWATVHTVTESQTQLSDPETISRSHLGRISNFTFEDFFFFFSFVFSWSVL